MRCECGACDLGVDDDAEDDVTQYCIEEAALIFYDAFVAAQHDAEREANRKPGEITDPVMQDALARAKELHAQTYGVRV